MTTPMSAFIDIASKYGGVDSADMAAVLRFYENDFEGLLSEGAESILDDLLDGVYSAAGEEPYGRSSYQPAPRLPTLEESPRVAIDAANRSSGNIDLTREDSYSHFADLFAMFVEQSSELIAARFGRSAKHSFLSQDPNGASTELMYQIAIGRESTDVLVAICNAAFASAERLTALNLNTARAVLNDGAANTMTLLAVKDVQELVALQSTMVQPSIEKAVAYSRNVYEIAALTQDELSKVVEGQMAEVTEGIAAALDQAAKSAPVGSEAAVAAVKAAINAANSAYESMAKAAEQIAEANLAAEKGHAVQTPRTREQLAFKKAG